MASHDNSGSVKLMVIAVKGFVKVKGRLQHRPVVAGTMELFSNVTYTELQSKVTKKLKLSNQIGMMYYGYPITSSHQINQAVELSDDEDVKIFMDLVRENKSDDLVTLYVVEFVPPTKWTALFKRWLSFVFYAFCGILFLGFLGSWHQNYRGRLH